MSKTAWILLIVLTALVLGGFGVYKITQANKFSAEAKDSAYTMVEAMRGLDGHEDYVGTQIERYHRDAFKVGYKSGGFTAQSFFDEETYLDELWKLIAQQAVKDEKQNVADALPRYEHFRNPPSPTGDTST